MGKVRAGKLKKYDLPGRGRAPSLFTSKDYMELTSLAKQQVCSLVRKMKERRYICPVCDKQVSGTATNIDHIIDEHSQQLIGRKIRHRCPLCTHMTDRRPAMICHFRRIHPNEEELVKEATAGLDKRRMSEECLQIVSAAYMSDLTFPVRKGAFREVDAPDESIPLSNEEEIQMRELEREQERSIENDIESDLQMRRVKLNVTRECPICKKCFPKIVQVKDHIVAAHSLEVTGEQFVIQCPVCSHAVTRYDAAQQHIYNQHPRNKAARFELPQVRKGPLYMKTLDLVLRNAMDTRSVEEDIVRHMIPATTGQSHMNQPPKIDSMDSDIDDQIQVKQEASEDVEDHALMPLADFLEQPSLNAIPPLPGAAGPTIIKVESLARTAPNSDHPDPGTLRLPRSFTDKFTVHSCPICEKRFSYTRILEDHIVDYHSKQLIGGQHVIRCTLCSHSAARYQTAYQHLRNNHKDRPEALIHLKEVRTDPLYVKIVKLAYAWPAACQLGSAEDPSVRGPGLGSAEDPPVRGPGLGSAEDPPVRGSAEDPPVRGPDLPTVNSDPPLGEFILGAKREPSILGPKSKHGRGKRRKIITINPRFMFPGLASTFGDLEQEEEPATSDPGLSFTVPATGVSLLPQPQVKVDPREPGDQPQESLSLPVRVKEEPVDPDFDQQAVKTDPTDLNDLTDGAGPKPVALFDSSMHKIWQF